MSPQKRFLRLTAGLGLVIVTLAAAFAVLLPVIHTWGAEEAEINRSMPGDELITDPVIIWTHAVTIKAPPEAVWPWIVQIGDTRGGFYSYTFIENQFAALIGGEGYNVTYTNADRIHPEWQNPSPGDQIIQGGLKIREVKAGESMLAEAIDPEAMAWTWIWVLTPEDGGERTRMIHRVRIQSPAMMGNNPVLGFMMDAGGFVMERNMIQGIKVRAEGGSEPGYIEIVEITIWLAALLAGLAAAVLFLVQKNWLWPLLTGIAAVLILVAFTILQPPIWSRILLDLLMIAGVWWSRRSEALLQAKNTSGLP